MFLNILKCSSLQKNIYKLCFPVPVRNHISFSKFNFRENKKEFLRLTYGIRCSVGIALLYGFSNFNEDLRKKPRIVEWLNHKFSHYAASIPPDEPEDNESPRTTFNFLADVVEKTQKTVVYIEISARHPLTGNSIPISNGSGFIVKEDGLILTNAHVVNHYGKVIVKLYNGQVFSGIVEHIDTDSDLATVRILARNLPVLPLGRSSDLRPGEFVIAMGNPLTLSHTITAGVVSSPSRQGKEIGLHKMSDYIQTDAAINVGNSGGPLVNLDGEAIGINTMKVTEGISFAIPSDRAVEFLKRIERSGQWNLFNKLEEKKKHKFLGITMLTLSSAVIKDLKEHSPDFPSVNHGVLVWRVMIGSPSYECGIRPGDVICSVNGSEVYNASQVQACLENEETLQLTVKRGTKTFVVSVPLVEPVMP